VPLSSREGVLADGMAQSARDSLQMETDSFLDDVIHLADSRVCRMAACMQVIEVDSRDPAAQSVLSHTTLEHMGKPSINGRHYSSNVNCGMSSFVRR